MEKYLLGIDQGTTSTKVVAHTLEGKSCFLLQKEFNCVFPKLMWVEQDPCDILNTTITCLKNAVKRIKAEEGEILAIGITNQRETTIIWDKTSGKPVYNAIVWQDRRTSDMCNYYIDKGYEKEIVKKTGLIIDPYFSATKIKWLLDNIDGLREKALEGKIAFGTVDTFLIWHLTGGRIHATDATNASRTMMFNLDKQEWDEDILNEFNIPKEILPEIKDSVADYGYTDKKLIGEEIKILAVLGDQQAAAVGQICFTPGQLKCTYGTGCFALMNIGETPVYSKNRLLTTVAYRLNGRPTYALEGSVFVAGAAVQWLRDNLKLIKEAAETEDLARSLDSNDGVYIVPSFTGLGAPHWDSKARGVIVGLTRNTGIAHFARAVLEAACYQTVDLYEAMNMDSGIPFKSLKVDGGMTDNKWMLQFLADISNIDVLKPKITQITAFGVSAFAGIGSGVYNSIRDIEKLWEIDEDYKPKIDEDKRNMLITKWRKAVEIAKEYK
ncbi:MAG: glycerol kinase GlpK [Deferribacterota bacterium]|nr:glycerol kinase GlpK [Deferribacterota bacterium]